MLHKSLRLFGSPRLSLRVAARLSALCLAGGLLWAAQGCSEPGSEYLDSPDMSTTGGGGGDDGGAKPDGGNPVTGDLPCEVRDLLVAHCQSCHGEPVKGAPVSLVTYAQLVAKSVKDPKKSYAERSLLRMSDAMSPMPPGPAPTVPQKEIDAFSAWVAAGSPSKKCEMMPPDDPWSKPPQCTSGKMYMGAGTKAEMNPGRACITCHMSKGKATTVTLAGTVYITGHEPDLCLGGPAAGGPAATVEITDANKRVINLPVNASGNFLYRDAMAIATPYTAVVKWNGKTRAMKNPQTNGDCNSCHSQNGANGAPGRIALP